MQLQFNTAYFAEPPEGPGEEHREAGHILVRLLCSVSFTEEARSRIEFANLHHASRELIALLSSDEFALEVRRRYTRTAAKRTRLRSQAEFVKTLALATDRQENKEAAAQTGKELEEYLPLSKLPADSPGTIYVLTDASGLFKIGRTITLSRRIVSIRSTNPSARLLAYFHTKNAPLVERILHNAFRRNRIVGEWFDLSGYGLTYTETVNKELA